MLNEGRVQNGDHNHRVDDQPKVRKEHAGLVALRPNKACCFLDLNFVELAVELHAPL